MGYRSCFSGYVALRKGVEFGQEEEQEVTTEDFYIEDEENGTYYISGEEWKMYYAYPNFEVLAKYFETVDYIEVEGENHMDIWRIQLKDGKIYTSRMKKPLFEEYVETEEKF